MFAVDMKPLTIYATDCDNVRPPPSPIGSVQWHRDFGINYAVSMHRTRA
jgi:hypothetical protein